jgi:hypothetical protein
MDVSFGDHLKHAPHQRADVTIFDAIASSEGGPFAFAVTKKIRRPPVPLPTRPRHQGLRRRRPGGRAGDVGVLAYSGPMPLG